MPRAKKNQPQQVAPGETYGDRQQLEQMQAQQPLPDVRAMGELDRRSAAVQQLEAMPAPPPGGILGAPSARPNEPITAGLPIGPGPGPEAVPMPTRQQDLLRQQLETAAQISGNPTLAKMAANARRPIGRTLPRGRPR